jgi:hypothetical protein
MHKLHALTIALFLALAVALGGFAALRTGALSASTKTASADSSISQRQQRLDRAQRQLQAALARKPPALPAISSNTAAKGRATRVEYVRPAPIVITRPAGSREHEDGEHEDRSEEGQGEDD